MEVADLSTLDDYIFQGHNGRPEAGLSGGEYFLQSAFISFIYMLAILLTWILL